MFQSKCPFLKIFYRESMKNTRNVKLENKRKKNKKKTINNFALLSRARRRHRAFIDQLLRLKKDGGRDASRPGHADRHHRIISSRKYRRYTDIDDVHVSGISVQRNRKECE